MARRKKNTSSVKVNFKGVEGRGPTAPEGDHLLEVLEVRNEQAKSSGNDQIVFVTEIADGEHKGAKPMPFYCPLSEESLWKLHALLTAMGVEVPDDEMDLDLSELVGEKFVGVITHDTFNGRKQAKITDFDSAENYEGKGKKDKKKDKKKGADKDDDKKSSKKDKSSKKSKDDDAGDKKKSSKKDKGADKKKDKGKKAKKIAESDVKDMDEDELEKLVDKHDLDVDLDDFPKLKKKIAAVIEALEDKDLLED